MTCCCALAVAQSFPTKTVRLIVPFPAGGATDLVARTVHPPTEIRLGVVTALCGGPFFLFLLLRHYRAASL